MVSITPISTHTLPASASPSSGPRKATMTRKQPLAIADASDTIEPQIPKGSSCQRTHGLDGSTNSISMKENVKASAAPLQHTQQPRETPHVLRRNKRSTRLSDRWPALMKMIKGQKAQYKEKKKLAAGHDASDTSSDEDDDAITIASSSRMRYPKYLPRVFHPTSPRYPSPLCGFLPVQRESAQRHLYIDRGFSRASLHNRRELWRRRRQDWEEYQSELSQACCSSEEAYGGIEEEKQRAVHLPAHLAHGPRRRCSSASLRDLPQELSEERPLTNPALFPRLGDLLSLRDSFLLSVDTMFDHLPLWSLAKLAWIFDLKSRTRHLLASSPRREDDNSSREPDGSNLSGDTLVPSLSEDNGHASCIVGDDSCLDFSKAFPSDVHCTSLRSIKELPISVHCRANTVELPGTTGLSSESASFRHSSAPLPYADDPAATKPWETCWLSRWEVIYHEISLTAELLTASDAARDLEGRNREILRKIYMSSRNLYHPFAAEGATLGIGEKESEICGASLCSTSDAGHRAILPFEEEDDYGVIIENPKYRLGATINPLSMFATSDPGVGQQPSSTTEVHVDDETGITTCTLLADKVGIEVC